MEDNYGSSVHHDPQAAEIFLEQQQAQAQRQHNQQLYATLMMIDQ